MRGDFSDWNKDRSQNFRGTLHQQGRVFLDRDWNDQTEIFNEWQDNAARDIIGPGVAAVPADEPDSFKVFGAAVLNGPLKKVSVEIFPGRIWADGLPIRLPRRTNFTATYFGDQNQIDPLPTGGIRDALILETWLEELNAFQRPDLLIEPALGGIDTTERVQTAFRFRLVRLRGDETCAEVVSRLNAFSTTGPLTAMLDPAQSTNDPCPVADTGGYTGFEHQLYRVEIAETNNPAKSWFKWSQFNGGLVGTGKFDADTNSVAVHGNWNAVVHSGLSDFYLEALDFDEDVGHWRVIYGAKAKLAADNTLTLLPQAFIGDVSAAAARPQRFFRLWNGIEPVSGFTSNTELPNNVGIKLKFTPENASGYMPSAYWTFKVRAGDIGNPTTLILDREAQGPFYHRVPLAELTWQTGNDKAVIEDCRQIFHPLTKLRGCCTYRVGDGKKSFGDFKSIQGAINNLPPEGGEICVLPGDYRECFTIIGRRNITLRGCGRRSRLLCETDDGEDPVIHVSRSQNIKIESLAVVAGTIGDAIAMAGREKMAGDGEEQQKEYLKEITLSRLFVIGSTRNGIRALNAQDLVLTDSTIHIRDLGVVPSNQQLFSGVYLTGDDMLVKGCEVRVVDAEARSEDHILAQNARGGIQIGSGSERVSIIDNVIACGTGNGITLGNIEWTRDGQVLQGFPGLFERDFIRVQEILGADLKPGAGAPLQDVSIESNRISFMGQNGIGIPAFFEVVNAPVPNVGRIVFTVSGLNVENNHIDSCVWIDGDILDEMLPWMGRGGMAFGDMDDLVVRDNFVVNNGIDYRRPVCGIYILRGEGVEISRNRIFGPVGTDPQRQGKDRLGARGGIWIERAMTPVPVISTVLGGGPVPFSIGTPALRIQENSVTVQLGRTLTAQIRGPVSIENNSFTTFNAGADGFFDRLEFFAAGSQAPSFRTAFMLRDMTAGNIFISDLSLVIAVERLLADLLPKRTTTFFPGRRFTAFAVRAAQIRTGSLVSLNQPSTAGTFTGSTTGTFTGSTAGTTIGSTAGTTTGSTATTPPGPAVGSPTRTNVGNQVTFDPATGILLRPAGGAVLSPGLAGGATFVTRPSEAAPFESGPTGAAAGSVLTPGMRFTSGTVLTHGAVTLPGRVFAGGPLFSSAAAVPIGTIGPIRVIDPVPVGAAQLLGVLRASEPRYTDNNILFTGNQCFQDNSTCGSCSSVVSILIACDADAGVHNNQAGCRLTDHVFPNQRRGSFPMMNTYVRARTCRVSNNRFIESIDETHVGDNRIDTFSAFTDALSDSASGMNITTDNIATHCLKVLGELFLDNYNLIEIERHTGDQMQNRERWCKRKREGTTVVFPTADPTRFTNMLDDLLAVDLGNDFNFQTAKAEAFRVEQRRVELRFGPDHQRAVAMRQKAEAGAANVRLAAGEHFAASTRMADAGKGWAVDGFVRTPGGEPVNRLTVAAYDDKGNWRKEFGHTCSDEKGYFLLKVEALPPAPAPTQAPVFLRISEGEKFVPSNEIKLTPAGETSHRVEIVVQHDPEHIECSRPPGGNNEPDPGPKPAPPPPGKGGSGPGLEAAAPPEEKKKPRKGSKKAPPPKKNK